MKSQIQTHGVQLASAKDVFLIAFILLQLLDDSFATEAPIVTISTGLVLGKRVSLRNDFLEQVDQYLGIPYAVPPIGDKRFRGTTYPVASWDDILNATTFGPVCPQAILDVDAATPRWIQKPIEDSKPFLEKMDEDCLYINVYVPLRSK
ncbi:putative neuroligin-4, Y-linked isoform X2 [Apostichopus japonicus]|uniref:Putative neuroligin-4, Y-linked isoform X2 n=1 Tax=Stichopus japonicus TaxID=307972 RepID=A0A2G8JJ05_STIJA|nr:putative neuroligin-4, Y-linked isoform X2 [Apostichopus japonicus]